MCGIVGMHCGNKLGFYANDRDALKGMLVVNSLRGIHSTGMMGFHRQESMKDQVNIVKTVGDPYDMFNWNRTDDFFARLVSTLGTVVGHGRYATRGEINARNAHPFEEENIVLVHNGGISNFHALKDNKKHEGIEVDSHLVARLFMEEGAEEILPRLRGAYTLVWYDTTDGTLHMARNAERPLFMGENDKDILFFASEAPCVNWANEKYDLGISATIALPTFTHLVFQKGSIEPEVKEYKEKYTIIPSTRNHRHHSAWDDEDGWSYHTHVQPRVTYPTDAKQLKRIRKRTGVTIGETRTFEVEDFDSAYGPQSQMLMIRGYNDAFPNVEFVFTTDRFKESELIECKQIVGTVDRMAIVSQDITIRKVLFRAYMKDAQLIFENNGMHKQMKLGFIDEDNHFAQVEDVTGEANLRLLSFKSMQEMKNKGCGWCGCNLVEEEIKHPENLGFWDFNDADQLICTVCMDAYRNAGKTNDEEGEKANDIVH